MAVIDKAEGSSTEADAEVRDGLEIKADSEIGEAINEQKDGPNKDGGEESGTDEDQTREVGGEVPKEEGAGDEVGTEEPTVAALSAKIAELEKKLSAPAPLAPKAEETAKPTPISEEEWAKYEEERGIPRTAQTWVTQTLGRVVNDIQRLIDQRFAKYDRQEVMSKLTQNPEFSDANKYSKEVDQYLQKVDPKYHSNEEVLKDAVIYARGLNYKKGVQTARNEKEINKRISGVARPASSGGTRGGGKSAPSLSALEKSAAAATGMSESEYASLKGKGRVIAN